MQMDPRFTDVFGELTGINLGDLQKNREATEEKDEENKKKFAERQA
jgi:hypothetical protein